MMTLHATKVHYCDYLVVDVIVYRFYYICRRQHWLCLGYFSAFRVMFPTCNELERSLCCLWWITQLETEIL